MHMVATLNIIMQFKIRQRASYIICLDNISMVHHTQFHQRLYRKFDAPLFMVARNFLYQWNKLMQLYGVKTMISSGPTMFAFT